jgi:hypothetical protein
MNAPKIPTPIVSYALYEDGLLVGFTNYYDFVVYFENLRPNRSHTITEFFEFH